MSILFQSRREMRFLRFINNIIQCVKTIENRISHLPDRRTDTMKKLILIHFHMQKLILLFKINHLKLATGLLFKSPLN